MKQWIDLTLGVLVSVSLLAAAGFFYVEIRRDEAVTAQYRRTVEAISATRMLASQWGIEVEKVRNEVNSNFDVLAGFIDRMDRHVAIIREAPRSLPQLPASVKWSLNGYVQRLKAQEERIERFKSGFAIVRNSRRFIPREGAELAEAARDGGHGKVETATLQIMAQTEDFLGRPTEVQRQRMERSLRALAGSAGGTALRAQADTLGKHVRALLRHYGLTEQRFRDILGSDLEDRAEQAIGLLDTDHARGRAMRRYYDYGVLLALGLVVSYWGFLAMRWIGGRRRRRAGERAQEAALRERVAPVLDVEAAWAAAGAPPGMAVSADVPPGAGTAEPQGSPAQARRVRERGAGQARAKFAAGGRPGLSLAERLRARSGGPADRGEPAGEERRPHGREERRPPAWEEGAPPGAAPMPPPAGDGQAAGDARADETAHQEGGSLAARLEALAKEVRPAQGEGSAFGSAQERPDVLRERGADPAPPPPAGTPATGRAPAPGGAPPADGDRTFEGRAPDRPAAPDAARMAGASARRIGATAAPAPPAAPDRPGVVHWAIREAVLERLREVEREIRAAADAAGQAERVSAGGNGEGRPEAWAAAAGRMAGVRWEVLSLLNEADGLPSAPAPSRGPEPIDLRVLLDARLDALDAEDRERIGTTLAAQAVTRGDPRALEGMVELVLRHALEGARLDPGGQGRVTVTLAEEPGASGVHLTCLGHGSGSSPSGERPGLVLAAARRLAEGQGGAMEITPYPGHGTMIRLRLPLHRSPAAHRGPAHGAGGEEGDGSAASRGEPWRHE